MSLTQTIPPFNSEAEARAYALGFNFGYIQAQLDDMQRELDRLTRFAESDPGQIAFEARAAHTGPCRCNDCESRKEVA